MKIKEATFSKSIKIGLPNYSNIDVSYSMTVEIAEGEKLDNNACWEHVNTQLYIQTDGIEPSWMSTKEYKNFFVTSIKTKKGGDSK